MEFSREFEREFMQRTLVLVKDYSGLLDATLLLNCLLGLLIVPKETSIEKIPTDPIEKFKDWGITPDSIKKFSKKTKKNKYPKTLRGIVWSLRNSVAHFRFAPIHTNKLVSGFQFHDLSGFNAKIEINEMKEFVEKLASYLEEKTTT